MNTRSKVIIVPCSTYDKETVYRAVKAGVLALGGIGSFIRHEERILVKPNYLSAADPDKAVTTHPAVIEAVLRLLSEYGCAPSRRASALRRPSVRSASAKRK